MAGRLRGRIHHTQYKLLNSFCYNPFMPYLSECIEQTFIVVVCDPATVLYLPQHVAHSVPGHTLGTDSTQTVQHTQSTLHSDQQTIHIQHSLPY